MFNLTISSSLQQQQRQLSPPNGINNKQQLSSSSPEPGTIGHNTSRRTSSGTTMWNNNKKTSTPNNHLNNIASAIVNNKVPITTTTIPVTPLVQPAINKPSQVVNDHQLVVTSGGEDSDHQDIVSRRKVFEEDAHLDSIIMVEKDCQQALEKIIQDPMSQNATQIEQQLWKVILKDYKSQSNPHLINYLIGFYVTLYETIFFSTQLDDSFLKFNRSNFLIDKLNQELMYNIHIRLGDLYRYADSRTNAKFYYQQALQIDPRRGTAYNQLALCTPLTKAYKCVYFSVRASKATIDSIKFADSNIKLAISRLNSSIFKHFRSSIPENPQLASEKTIDISYPEIGSDWFYLAVISIYFNNFNLTLVALLDYIMHLVDKNDESIDLDYSLMALEVTLDWIMKDRNNLTQGGPLEQTLKAVSYKFKNLLSGDEDSEEANTKLASIQKIGLKHNFMLRDFVPLKDLYERMHYYDEMQRYVANRDRKILCVRLIHKLQNF